MYGTLENKSGNQESSLESQHQLAAGGISGNILAADGNNKNRWQSSNSDEFRKRKRIYSHCHIQATENKPTNVDKSARRRLIAASIICLIFMIGEVVGGVLSNSLAIATDAAHLLTDFASFMISLFAIWLSSRPATRKMSFGWYRAEVIGALLSVLMIWFVTGLLVYLAVERIRTNDIKIDSLVMVITASAGLVVNIIMGIALNVDGHGHTHGLGGHHHHHHHHNHEESREHEPIDTVAGNLPPISSNGITQDAIRKLNGSLPNGSHHQNKKPDPKAEANGRGRKNINVRAAFIHVVGDFLQSLGVLVAALVIHFEPSYALVDPICTFIFSIIVLITTINIIRDATNVLMEGIPDGINFSEVREKLQDLPSVIRVHNLRIWSLSLDKIAISTHLVIDDSQTPSQALRMAIETLKSSYNFFEVTIQVEEYRDDMRDCEHCQDEEVVINVVDDNHTGPISASNTIT